MKSFIVTLLFLPFFSLSQKNSKDYSNALIKRFNKYDSSLIFIAIERSKKLSGYFPKNIFEKYYENDTHNFKTSGATKVQFMESVKTFYSKAKNKKLILEVIDNWHSNDSLLNNITQDNNIPTEQILFTNKLTNNLFKKYLNRPGKTWESLSSWQSYELYVDFMNYAEKLSKADRAQLFSSLRRTSKKLKL